MTSFFLLTDDDLYYKKFNAFELSIWLKNDDDICTIINVTCPRMVNMVNKLCVCIVTSIKDYDTIIEKYGKSERSMGIFVWTLFKDLYIEIEKELFRYYKIKGWTIIKALTKVLSLHKRAVERVNHPDRLLQAGVFQEL